MPHSESDRKRVVSRLRRIRGQAEALERAVTEGTSCGAVLQQLAAMRGAINGLMATVLDDHLRERFGHADCKEEDVAADPVHADMHAAIDETVALVRSYLK